MSIKLDGPVMVVPVEVAEAEGTPGIEAVWVFIGLLVAIGLYLRFG